MIHNPHKIQFLKYLIVELNIRKHAKNMQRHAKNKMMKMVFHCILISIFLTVTEATHFYSCVYEYLDYFF